MADLLSGIGQAMKHLGERQRVIAGNIANSETPGFKAQELERPDFGGMVRPQVKLTGAMAALGARGSDGAGRLVADKDVGEVKPDGNNVTLEDQLLKMGRIGTDYATLSNLYRKQMQLVKTAIGRGGA